MDESRIFEDVEKIGSLAAQMQRSLCNAQRIMGCKTHEELDEVLEQIRQEKEVKN